MAAGYDIGASFSGSSSSAASLRNQSSFDGGTINFGSKTPGPGDLGLYLILGVFGLVAIWIIWGRKH